MALLVKKIENECKSKDISTREMLPGVQGVSRNPKLSTKYDFYSLKVSHQVLIEKTLKTQQKTYDFLCYYVVFQSLVN